VLLSPLVALALLAGPQAPARAELVTFVPRLDALRGALPFFQAAGSRSALLRPEAWRAEALPLLSVDVTSQDSLDEAGLDAAGPLTVSHLQERTLSCVRVADARRFKARVDAALQRQGTRFEVVRAGLPIVGARDPLNRVLDAVATRGAAACALHGDGLSVEPLFQALAEALTQAPQGAGYQLAAATPGLAQLIQPGGPRPFSAGLSASGLGATLKVRAQGLEVPRLLGSGPSPYAALSAPGLAVVRARFARAAMPEVLARLAREVPAGAALAELAPALAPLLTGEVAGLFGRVKVSTGLRTAEARFHAVKLALVARTSDPTAAAALVASLDAGRLAVREGRLSLSVVGDAVVLANDDEARRQLLAALPGAAGAQAHGLELVADPPRLAGALAQVPLLEVVQAPELAGVLAAATELGPLLLASRAASFWLDPLGGAGQVGQLSWSLDEGHFPADAGVR
jgi:hypothetical protein